MMLKLVIIGVVAVAVLVAFSGEINTYFPNTVTTGIDSFRQDVGAIASSSAEIAGERLDSSSKVLRENVSEVARQATQATASAEEQLDSAAGKIGETISGLQG